MRGKNIFSSGCPRHALRKVHIIRIEAIPASIRWASFKYPEGSEGAHKGQSAQSIQAPVKVTARPNKATSKILKNNAMIKREKDNLREYFIINPAFLRKTDILQR